MPLFGETFAASGTPAPAGPDAGATSAPSTPDPSVAAPGTGDTTGGQPAAPVTPAADKQYIDTSQLGDHYVKVRVDGADMELPLKDALQGVMMQQAFTRRTQALADERRQLGQAQQLVNALENNPRETLAQLAQAYELDLGSMDTSAEADPMEQRFATLENQIRQQNQSAARMQIQRELEQLKTQFGEFDHDAVVNHAFQNRIPITTAYRDLNYERLLQQQQRDQVGAANRNNALAAQVVEGGQTTQAGSLTPSGGQINSVRDAWNAAKKQHGITN